MLKQKYTQDKPAYYKWHCDKANEAMCFCKWNSRWI